MKKLVTSATFTAMVLASLVAWSQDGKPKISFKKKQLDSVFRSEGVAVGDFNKDGKLDIANGSAYWAAPDWKMHAILDKPKEVDPHGYSDSFCVFADDINRDGWDDILVVGFPGKETRWYANPQGADGPWKVYIATDVTNNESPQYTDVDGDGQRELVMGYSPDPKNPDGPDRRMALVRPGKDPTQKWIIQVISAKAGAGARKYEHGLGIGDVNKDGLADVITTSGWYQNPGKEPQPGEWQFTRVALGPACAHMYAYDFDGDGDNDIVSSAAHNYGIWWYEQTEDGFKQHEIEKSFSQTHSLCFADINGDGLPDLITGKRWWAHGPKGDPGSDQPAVMFWFELSKTKDGPKWIPHQFDHDSGVGTQFQVADVNGDGLLDVVTSNKQGTFYFQQVRE